MKKLLTMISIGLLLTSAALAQDASVGSIHIERPAVRAMVPGAKVGGGYLTIANQSPEADRLLSATSNRAKSVQLHEMRVDNGVMVMRELKDGIDIPAGQTLALKPGGDHLMFMDVDQPFRQGEDIKAVLTFEKAGAVEVDFLVGPITGPLETAQQDHGAGEMSGMAMGADAASDDPQQAIPKTLKTMFETPDKALLVEPVVVQNDWAIAGWQQDGRGGRALLKRGPHGWRVHLCSGDGIKDAEALQKIGMSQSDAVALSASLRDAEAKLDPKVVSLFATFDGTVMMGEETGGAGGQGGHEGHSQ